MTSGPLDRHSTAPIPNSPAMRPYITLNRLGTHYSVLSVQNKEMGREELKMKMKKVLQKKAVTF